MAIESLPTFTKPARQRWESIPADIRQQLLSNVWCGQCRPRSSMLVRHRPVRIVTTAGPLGWISPRLRHLAFGAWGEIYWFKWIR